MEHIDIVLYQGFDEVDAIAPFEVLRNAGFDARLVTLDGSGPVTGSHGAVIEPHGALDDQNADLVLVPGGGWNDRSEQGAWGEAQRGELPNRLRQLHDDGTALAAVCTGGMLLAAAGILEDRPATTHHGAHQDLENAGAQLVSDARVVDDGDVLTCGGVTSGIDLALWITERERGREIADAVAREMEHERSDRVRQTHG